MDQSPDFFADLGSDTEFLFQFPAHRIARLFAIFNLASRKFPFERHRLMPRPLAGEKEIMLDDQRGYDSFHDVQKMRTKNLEIRSNKHRTMRRKFIVFPDACPRVERSIPLNRDLLHQTQPESDCRYQARQPLFRAQRLAPRSPTWFRASKQDTGDPYSHRPPLPSCPTTRPRRRCPDSEGCACAESSRPDNVPAPASEDPRPAPACRSLP